MVIAKLETRFDFMNDALADFHTGSDSKLWQVSDKHDDGTQKTLRLWKKTNTTFDRDLRELLSASIRRLRRVLASRGAREVVVEVLEIVEDEEEIGVLLIDAGRPISKHQSQQRSHQQADSRILLWQNVHRIVKALGHLHRAKIVHGNVCLDSILSEGLGEADYKLSGFEWSLHLVNDLSSAVTNLTRPAQHFSFRRDWQSLGKTVASLFGVDENSLLQQGESFLTVGENRVLDRLLNPPKFEPFDAEIIQKDITRVILELEQNHTTRSSQFVLYPVGEALRTDIPLLAKGIIDPGDTAKLLEFVTQDITSSETKLVPTQRDTSAVSTTRLQIHTDGTVYTVIIDGSGQGGLIGRLSEARRRKSSDPSYDPRDLPFPIHLVGTRKSAIERVGKLGSASASWQTVFEDNDDKINSEDSDVWSALILMEVFALLKAQFKIFPVKVHDAKPNDGTNLIRLISRPDETKDKLSEQLQLPLAERALRRILENDVGGSDWVLTSSAALGGISSQDTELVFQTLEPSDEGTEYCFHFSRTRPDGDLYLRPARDTGFEIALRRRLHNIVAARDNTELLNGLDDPRLVEKIASNDDQTVLGEAPNDLDTSKQEAWGKISQYTPLGVVVGPPGVGKTYLISQIVKRITHQITGSRILISAQSHDALANLERAIQNEIDEDVILVRIERNKDEGSFNQEERQSSDWLKRLLESEASNDVPLGQLVYIKEIVKAGQTNDSAERIKALRDTNSLVRRSANIVLAATNSFTVEEMIANGEQFDWVIIDEAARANAAELIGPLMLGNRRILVGDHHQLPPFQSTEDALFYVPNRSTSLLENARKQIETIPFLPTEVDQVLKQLEENPDRLKDVMAMAARMSEPFRDIVEADEERNTGTPGSRRRTTMLREQSRMHPFIGQLVSNTFYQGKLIDTERVKKRVNTIGCKSNFPTSPIVLLDFPPLSRTSRQHSFEQALPRPWSNESEADAIITAMGQLEPIIEGNKVPTMAVLSPYTAQVAILKKKIAARFDIANNRLLGFKSVRGENSFVETVDSFQGSEADVVLVSLVRNNARVGVHSLGFLQYSRRMNVLLSRARQKLIIATSVEFLIDAISGVDPDELNPEFDFLRRMTTEIKRLSTTESDGSSMAATILPVSQDGSFTW
ncbi:MAG: AAA family ATPase [Oleispira sp.]|nr:AAA family ATPase [Oleispira sp.]